MPLFVLLLNFVVKKQVLIGEMVILPGRNFEDAARLKTDQLIVFIVVGAGPVLVNRQTLSGCEDPLVVRIKHPFLQ